MLKFSEYLEEFLLINFCFFIVLSLYSKILAKILIYIAIILWVLINICRHKSSFYRYIIPENFLSRPILLFGLAAVLAVIFSIDPYLSQQVFFSRYVMYFVFFVIGVYFAGISKTNIKILTYALLLSSFCFGLGGLIDHFYLKPERLFSSFGLVIPFQMFALYLVYFIPFNFVIFLFSKDKWLRIAGLVNLLLLFPCWIWQLSRAAWVAVILTLPLVLIIKKRFLAGLVITMILISMFLSTCVKQRFSSTFTPGIAWGDRVPMWEVAGEIIHDYPVFGAGLGMYEKLMYKYKPKHQYLETYNLHCHNTYLEVMTEMGSVGVLAFIFIFIVFLKEIISFSIKCASDFFDSSWITLLGLTGTIISALIFAIAGTIITVGISEPAMFWFLLGAAVGIIERYRKGFSAIST